jgi:hypothetical protein
LAIQLCAPDCNQLRPAAFKEIEKIKTIASFESFPSFSISYFVKKYVFATSIQKSARAMEEFLKHKIILHNIMFVFVATLFIYGNIFFIEELFNRLSLSFE